eukprot:evm.model.scf_777.1 EVM.evm.TU.scf_777.1   scf_777:1946-4493(+)
MACDANCAQACVDKDGCTACGPGYYTSRQDDEWPYECLECPIPNCLTCRGAIYHAWPAQCEQCVGGFTQANDRKECVPFGSSTEGGSVEGSSLTRPPETSVPPYVPPQEGSPSVPLGPVYQMPPAPGLETSTGTPTMDMVLPPGYIMPSPRPDITSSYPTTPSTYAPNAPPNPVVPPAQLTFPPPPPPVYPQPVPVPPPAPLTPPQPISQAPPNPDVSPELISRASCPAGSFVKNDGSCMGCDQFCLPGQCQDGRGCGACQDGYFTRAVDPEWPNVCVLCELPNCVKCIDNSYDAWPMLCAQCAAGYELATDRTCVPEGGVGGQSFAQRAAPPAQYVDPPVGALPEGPAVPPQQYPTAQAAPRRRPRAPGGTEGPATATATARAGPAPPEYPPKPKGYDTPQGVSEDYDTPQGVPQGSGAASAKATATAVGRSSKRRKGAPKAQGAAGGYPKPDWPESGLESGPASATSKATVTVVGSGPSGPASVPFPRARRGSKKGGSASASASARATAVSGHVAAEPSVLEVYSDGQPELQEGGGEGDGPDAASASANAQAVGGIHLTPGLCPKGEFMKEHDRTCIKCDRYCEPGSCVDGMGCNQCRPGYYRSRRDTFWPYLCVQCSAAISGCEVCADGVLDENPACVVCANGKDPIDGNCPA